MEIEIKQLIGIRAQATNQFTSEGVSPEDLLFHVIDEQMGMTLVPFQGDFPPSYKYNARKQALSAMLNGTLSPQLKRASRLIYFSIDNVYNVDYCFDIDMYTKGIVLYIIKDGNIVRRYKNYDVNYDERNDIAQL